MPFHKASAVAMLAFDYLWAIPDFLVVDWIVTIPLCFLSVAASTYWIQRRWHGDGRRSAAWKAALLGTIAAVPFQVASTAAGLAFLAWLRIRRRD